MKGYIFEGLGNRFIIVKKEEKTNFDIIPLVCDQYNADGFIFINENNYSIKIYNRDGSIASMCGNGIRCVGHYLYSFVKEQKNYQIITDVGIKHLDVISSSPFVCKVNLGRPHLIKELYDVKKIDIDDQTFFINSVFLTNYQVVIMVENILDPIISKYAERIFSLPLFSNKCNITFCQIISYHQIKTITYERGVGFTSSCGTGASSAAYISYLLYNLSSRIKVKQKDGELLVIINDDIYLQGESSFIKEINIDE